MSDEKQANSPVSILAFEAAGMAYALLTSDIREVIPACPVALVPNLPDYVLGVLTLRHEVIPVVDLGVLLGSERSTTSEHRRCFVIVHLATSVARRSPIGIAVDGIQEAYRLEPDRVDPPPTIASRLQADYVAGFARTDDGVKIVLDVERLFAAGRKELEGIPDQSAHVESINGQVGAEANTQASSTTASPKLKLLSIKLAGTEFAFPTREIRRSVPLRAIRRDTLAPDILCGAMELAGEQLGLIELRSLLGLPPREPSDKSPTVIVAEQHGVHVGYLVDVVGDLYSIEESALKPLVGLGEMANSGQRGLGFLELPDRTMEVLSFDKLVSASTVRTIENWKNTVERVKQLDDIAHNGIPVPKPKVDPELAKHAGTYVVVRVGKYLMGIDAVSAEEIVRYESMTVVSRAVHDFAGALQLRDRTYPVMDLCRHFDIPEAYDESLKRAIVLVRSSADRVGLAVQHIEQLARIAPDDLLPKSQVSIDVFDHLVTCGAELSIGRVILLNVPAVLSDGKPSMRRSWEEFQSKANKANARQSERESPSVLVESTPECAFSTSAS